MATEASVDAIKDESMLDDPDEGKELVHTRQIICRGYDEAMALRIGWAYQEVTDWHLRRPPE